METGPKQHFVPQQMIRRFADDSNHLRAMRKPDFEVLKQAKGPKGILWKEDYYKDGVGDLDAEWLTPIEQRFAKYYPKLADKPWNSKTASKDEGEAFVDWTISQLCRTHFLIRTIESIMPQQSSLMQIANAMHPALLTNMLRQQLFNHLKEVYTLPGWRWKCFVIRTDANLVLTDHPVCSTPSTSSLGHVIFVPLSKKRIIFGGSKESLARIESMSALDMNCILSSWAEEWIYAEDEATLLDVARELKGNGRISDSKWLLNARKPLFGLPERAAKMPILDSSNIFEEMKNHYRTANAG